MEYIEYGDLGQLINRDGETAKVDAKEVAAQILEGLVVLHERGISHHDLKPEVRHDLHIKKIRINTNQLLLRAESPYCLCHADMGQNHRFRDPKTLYGNLAEIRFQRRRLLSGPRTAANTT